MFLVYWRFGWFRKSVGAFGSLLFLSTVLAFSRRAVLSRVLVVCARFYRLLFSFNFLISMIFAVSIFVSFSCLWDFFCCLFLEQVVLPLLQICLVFNGEMISPLCSCFRPTWRCFNRYSIDRHSRDTIVLYGWRASISASVQCVEIHSSSHF